MPKTNFTQWSKLKTDFSQWFKVILVNNWWINRDLQQESLEKSKCIINSKYLRQNTIKIKKIYKFD